VLPAVTAEDGLDIAERLCRAIAATPLPHGAEWIGIMVSVGLAMAGDAGDTIERAIGRADTLLSQAKQTNGIAFATARPGS